jgi:hypothetical protein
MQSMVAVFSRAVYVAGSEYFHNYKCRLCDLNPIRYVSPHNCYSSQKYRADQIKKALSKFIFNSGELHGGK